MGWGMGSEWAHSGYDQEQQATENMVIPGLMCHWYRDYRKEPGRRPVPRDACCNSVEGLESSPFPLCSPFSPSRSTS